MCGLAKCKESGVEQQEMIEKISFGIPREPEDFVREAVRAGHPRFLDYKSIEHVDVLIQRNLNTDLKKVVKVRKLGTRILLPPALLSKQQDSPQLPQWIVNPFRTTQAHQTRSVLFT